VVEVEEQAVLNNEVTAEVHLTPPGTSLVDCPQITIDATLKPVWDNNLFDVSQ